MAQAASQIPAGDSSEVTERKSSKRKTGALSPMLQKYIQYKEEYPDCLLFCQVGDFYELFFDDAVTVSRCLNLTLTSRDKNQAEPIPMCGVPLAVVDGYVDRLVDLGYSVAIVSQCSDPVPGKMVERKLERIVTPAIRVMGGVKSEASGGEIVASVVLTLSASSGGAQTLEGALAHTEIESGAITMLEPLSVEQIVEEIQKLAVRELILPDAIQGKKVDMRSPWVRRLQQILPEGGIKFRSDRYLNASTSEDRDFSAIQGFTMLGVVAKKAVKLLLNYVDETTVDSIMSIDQIRNGAEEDVVLIDATTRANLELVKTLKGGEEEGSLYGYLKQTVTPGGARLLKKWILHPLRDASAIQERLSAVRILKAQSFVRNELQSLLASIPDLERGAARIDLGIVTPLELAVIRDGLAQVPSVLHQLQILTKDPEGDKSQLLAKLSQQIVFPVGLHQKLKDALVENPPLSLVDGGYLQNDYNQELSRLRAIRSEGNKWLTTLEAEEKESTGIPSLKVKYNNVLGYFIEVTRTHLKKVPDHYIKRQSMVNAERYTTEALKQREEEILNSKAKAIKLERELFDEFKSNLKAFCAEIKSLHTHLATLDVLLAFARVAEDNGCVEPQLSADKILHIEQGRHPILDQILQQRFIPNDLLLDAQGRTCLLLTGPNMGGKSTYLRQSALIALLTHIGAFVPARSATVGVMDRVFARLGASDDIAEGDSTFMVEMKEASLILSKATESSLVLIDEIGRGTATSDGRSLAQAILESIAASIKCRTIFATHFHELTALEKDITGVKNISVGSLEKEDQVYFTHEICDGPASRSYGIEVATMAGLPSEVLLRARDLLQRVSSSAVETPAESQPSQQLSFFSSSPQVPSKEEKELEKIRNLIDEIQIEHTTPLKALHILEELKTLLS